MQQEPIWVNEQVALAVHTEQLAEHKGGRGIRDLDLLHSALAAPQNIFFYNQANIFKLAAVYGFMISNNQPFIDGNKRTGYTVTRLFLILNGFDIQASEADRVQMFLNIARNVKSEDALAQWLEHWAIKLTN